MNNITELLLFIISVLPVFLIGLYIYKKDKEKESSKILIKLFLGGIGSCFIVLIISYIMYYIFPFFTLEPEDMKTIQLLFKVFIGIALVEEFSKWIMTYIISYNDKGFNELYDAIIYCVFVALGFACFENLMYVYQNGITTGIIRAISAVPGHACDGLLMGYFLGLSKISSLNNRNDLKRKNIILSMIVPTIIHGIYDYCLFSGNFLLIIFLIIFVICTYVYSIKKIKKISSLNKKFKYKDNYCPNCGHIVDNNFCPICGRKNE